MTLLGFSLFGKHIIQMERFLRARPLKDPFGGETAHLLLKPSRRWPDAKLNLEILHYYGMMSGRKNL
jgi:hypothetical protein